MQYFDISTPENSDNDELDQGGNALPSQQPKQRPRLMVEWCCSPDSKLGQPRAASKGCTVLRVTESEDATAKECVEQMTQKTIKFWKDNHKCKVHVHISLPCTGGCPWNNVNKDLLGGKERIQQHRKKFTTLLKNVDKFLDSISVVFPSNSLRFVSIGNGRVSNALNRNMDAQIGIMSRSRSSGAQSCHVLFMNTAPQLLA